MTTARKKKYHRTKVDKRIMKVVRKVDLGRASQVREKYNFNSNSKDVDSSNRKTRTRSTMVRMMSHNNSQSDSRCSSSPSLNLPGATSKCKLR